MVWPQWGFAAPLLKQVHKALRMTASTTARGCLVAVATFIYNLAQSRSSGLMAARPAQRALSDFRFSPGNCTRTMFKARTGFSVLPA